MDVLWLGACLIDRDGRVIGIDMTLDDGPLIEQAPAMAELLREFGAGVPAEHLRFRAAFILRQIDRRGRVSRARTTRVIAGPVALVANQRAFWKLRKCSGHLRWRRQRFRASAILRAQLFDAVILGAPSYETSIPKYFLLRRVQFFVASLTCGRRLPNPPPTG